MPEMRTAWVEAGRLLGFGRSAEGEILIRREAERTSKA